MPAALNASAFLALQNGSASTVPLPRRTQCFTSGDRQSILPVMDRLLIYSPSRGRLLYDRALIRRRWMSRSPNSAAPRDKTEPGSGTALTGVPSTSNAASGIE